MGDKNTQERLEASFFALKFLDCTPQEHEKDCVRYGVLRQSHGGFRLLLLHIFLVHFGIEMKLYRSDWIGIVLGVAIGAYQPFDLINKPMIQSSPPETLIPILFFGLLGPPILALIVKFLPQFGFKFYEKIGAYINFIFLIIAYGISTGTVGLIYHLFFTLPDHALVPIAFFGASGVGFLGAYFVNPQLAFRPDK